MAGTAPGSSAWWGSGMRKCAGRQMCGGMASYQRSQPTSTVCVMCARCQHMSHAGAVNMDLEGVYHSPLGAVEAAEGGGRPWYGSPGVLEQWVHTLGVPAQTPATP